MSMYGTIRINKLTVIDWTATRQAGIEPPDVRYHCDVVLRTADRMPDRGVVFTVTHDPGEGALVLAHRILATAIEKGLR